MSYPIQGIVLYWVSLDIILGYYLKILNDRYEIKKFKRALKINLLLAMLVNGLYNMVYICKLLRIKEEVELCICIYLN